jgi:hypothetical protein
LDPLVSMSPSLEETGNDSKEAESDSQDVGEEGVVSRLGHEYELYMYLEGGTYSPVLDDVDPREPVGTGNVVRQEVELISARLSSSKYRPAHKVDDARANLRVSTFPILGVHGLTKLLLRTRLGMMGYLANFHSHPMNTTQSTAPTQYIAMIEAKHQLHSKHGQEEGSRLAYPPSVVAAIVAGTSKRPNENARRMRPITSIRWK